MIETRITYQTTEGGTAYAHFYGAEWTDGAIRESLTRDLSDFHRSISKRVRTVAGPR